MRDVGFCLSGEFVSKLLVLVFRECGRLGEPKLLTLLEREERAVPAAPTSASLSAIPIAALKPSLLDANELFELFALFNLGGDVIGRPM